MAEMKIIYKTIIKIYGNEITQNYEINTDLYDYKNYSTIKLLHSKTNTIEELPLDEYLYGVV